MICPIINSNESKRIKLSLHVIAVFLDMFERLNDTLSRRRLGHWRLFFITATFHVDHLTPRKEGKWKKKSTPNGNDNSRTPRRNFLRCNAYWNLTFCIPSDFSWWRNEIKANDILGWFIDRECVFLKEIGLNNCIPGGLGKRYQVVNFFR